jgi:two-component system chemotaxis response regulator CheY
MTAHFAHFKVMLVDDEEFVRTIMKRMLHGFGINLIDEAKDGHDALKQLECSCPNLLFLDLLMEPMDGLELLRRMRAHKVDSIRNLPVIVLTLNSDAETVKQVMPLGVQDYLVKPVFPDILRAKLEQFVGHEGVVK